jgi:two-component system response regulator HydG
MSQENRSRILVVDDDADICHNLVDILHDLGYDADFALNGLAALELVRKQPYDVALLDLKMPGMDGLALYREIKNLRADTVSMLVTAYAGQLTEEQALDAGAWKVLPKPVDFPKLLGYVEEALDQPLVLIVDDDTDLCSSLWDLFRQQGYRLCLAHDYRAAASHLAQSQFQVVLIDMRIPDADGAAVFQMVRATNPRSRTILITGHRSETDDLVASVLAEGADAVCYKPFDVPELVRTVERMAAARAEEPRGSAE